MKIIDANIKKNVRDIDFLHFTVEHEGEEKNIKHEIGTEDEWGGFSINGKEYDFNLYEGIVTIYPVVGGNTDTTNDLCKKQLSK